MFYVQLAPLGVLFGPLNTLFLQKGHFPQQIWLKICVWNPKNLPDLNSRAGKWDFFGPKISLRVVVLKKAEITPEAQGCPPQPAPLQKSPLQGIHPCRKVFTGYPSLSRNFYRIYPGYIHPCQEFFTGYSFLPSTLNQIFSYRFQTPLPQQQTLAFSSIQSPNLVWQ